MEIQGLYVIKRGNKNILMYGGSRVSNTQEGVKSSFGLYVNGNRLELDGAGIAVSPTPTFIKSTADGAFFGDTLLNNRSGVCVNITIDDYNELLKGNLVDGYKAFDPTEVYNIVEDVSLAEDVTYTVSDGVITFSDETASARVDNMIHTESGLIENTVDPTQTITDTKCPFVNVRYFDPFVPIGEAVELEYYVDTQDNASLNRRDISDTFTVIVTTASGAESKKTTYAGRFKIETPTFDVAGETWFSIECIDSNGVGSAVQYFDVLVCDEVVPNYYTMQESDLEKYGIVRNDGRPQVGYANKVGFSTFFDDLKKDGRNGVVLLKGVYYIDYHNTFGTQTYMKATIDTATRLIESIEECNENDVKLSGVRRTFPVSAFPSAGEAFAKPDVDLAEWSENNWIVDGCIYYVVNTSTSDKYIEFPDEFTVDMNRSEFRACKCEDLQAGSVIRLENNFDTHIKNGSVRGNYDRYEFHIGSIRNGSPNPSEHLCATYINKSRFCTFENLDISYSVGYEACSSGGKWGEVTPEFSNGRVDLSDPDGSVISSNSHVVTQMIDVAGKSDVTFGRNGYAGYGKAGTQREVFYSFYDSQGDYISTVKSKMYFLCKIPAGAKWARLTCFGKTSTIEMSTAAGGLRVWTEPIPSKCIKFLSCYWHNTRTCALQDFNAQSVLRYGCKYKNIAKESGDYEITPYLGDFEDGWQNYKDSAIINCEYKGGNGSGRIMIHFCNNLTFVGNKKMSITNRGGIESGFVEDNTITDYNCGRNYRSIHPFVIYKNNIIGTMNVIYSNDKENTNFTDTVERIIAMDDSVIKNRCVYEDLVLTRSSNGDNGFA